MHRCILIVGGGKTRGRHSIPEEGPWKRNSSIAAWEVDIHVEM